MPEQFVNPFFQGLQAYQAGQQFDLQQQQIEQQQALMQRRDQMKADLAQFAQRSGKTAEDYQRFAEMYPEMGEQMKASISNLNAQQKQEKINQLLPIYAALSSGNTDAAKERIKTLQDAYKTSGMPTEANNLEMLNENIDIDPKAALTSSGLFLAQAMGPEEAKKFFEATKVAGEERRAEQLQPGEVKKQSAEIVKIGIDNGLTQQEALRTAAQTKKLDAETKKIIMETAALEKQGGLDPEKRFDQERKLAKEYSNQTADFTSIRDSYRRLTAVDPTPAGDISLVFNYMKMLDPGSVVREGEYATAKNAAGIPERIMNMYNKAVDGVFLTEKQRKDFKNQADKLMKSMGQREKEIRGSLDTVAKNYGLNPDNIFIGAPEEEKETQKQITDIKQQSSADLFKRLQTTMTGQ